VTSPYPTADPSYGTAAAAAPDSPWRLVLSSGAKKLMVFFIILGAVFEVGGNIVQAAFSHPLRGIEAAVRVQAAYESLNTSVIAYHNDTNACRGSSDVLTCVTGTDRTVGNAFGAFVARLNAVSVPSDATAAASALAADGTKTEQVFEQLARSTSTSQYETNNPTANLTQVLTQFSQDYQTLINRLE
jgi:hypothetical protein